MTTINSERGEQLHSRQDLVSPLTVQRQRLLQHAGAVINRDLSEVAPADLARLSQTLMTALELLKVADDEMGEERRTNATIQAAQDRRVEQLETMFSLAPTPLLLTTGDTTIREANVACSRLIGLDAYSLTGTQLSSMVPPAEVAGFRKQLALTIEMGGVDAWTFTLKLKRSAPTQVCATVQLVDDPAVGSRALYWNIRAA